MINLIKKIFFRDSKPKENAAKTSLKVYNNRIEISKYSELYPNFQVVYSSTYSYITPPEVLEKINNGVILWIDNRNDIVGFSNREGTLLFKYSTIKSFHITNVLPAKGRGASYFSVRLLGNERGFDLAKSTCNAFNNYLENIIETTGIQVIFDPEEYDC